MSRGAIGATIIVLLALLACKSKTEGTITLDGQALEIESCESGQRNTPVPFVGVDFIDSYGRRIRFVQQNTGQVRLFVFDPGATQGTLIGENCGTVAVATQNSEVNGVKNISGTVSANCTGSGHVVTATVNYKNCH